MKRLVWIIATLAASALLVPVLVGMYIFKYVRPEHIQVELIGRPLATSDSLVRFDHSMTGYGDAQFIWTYSPPNSSALTNMCQLHDRGRCIIRQRLDNDGRYVAISLLQGQLIVEESWS